MVEEALTIPCDADGMIAVLHRPERPGSDGLLIAVGGPQYRVGSHRQFVLLARHLAAQGIPVLRFDYRGVGDSSGTFKGFETVETDIRCAIDEFFRLCPETERLRLWGLCDAASAALLYVKTDPRVSGIVLLNPWVRTEAGLAKAVLSTWYRRRLSGLDLWKDLVTGRLNILESAASLAMNLKLALRRQPQERNHRSPAVTADPPAASFVESMLSGLHEFHGQVLIIIAGNDITGGEFRALVEGDRRWKRAVNRPNVAWMDVPDANHTFSTREWRNKVEDATTAWILGG